MKKEAPFIALLVFLLIPFAHAAEVFLFQADGCYTCDRMFNFLMGIAKKDELTVVNAFYVDYDPTHKQMLDLLAEKYEIKTVDFPVVFIDDTAFIGYNPNIKDKIREKIELCKVKDCYSAANAPIDESFHIEKGETTYIESYKTGSGILQGIFLIFVIIGIVFIYFRYQKVLIRRRECRRKKLGRKRTIKRAK